LFQDVPFQFPDALFLYNIRTQRKYAVQTGQGDSEILLMDGTMVYYRLNDTVYKASFEQTAIGMPVEILNDPYIQLAHFAFFGPRAQ
jgi:hypothetical protein